MQEVVPFDFQGKSVRVIQDAEGNLWWVATDVCKVLGIANPSDAIKRLDDDEKMTLEISESLINHGLSNNAPGTRLNLVNEPGLYHLILRSNKPEAKEFRRWITHEVIPSLRKTGSYSLPSSAAPAPAITVPILREEIENNKMLAELIRSYSQIYTAIGIRGAQKRLAIEQALFQRHGIELGKVAPLPGPAQTSNGRYAVVVEDRLVSPTQLGAALGIGAREVNRLLEEKGLQVRQDKDWVPTKQGRDLSDWVETGKRYHSGAPITMLRWREQATLEVLKAASKENLS
jgi:prophage antirepressor-like protein